MTTPGGLKIVVEGAADAQIVRAILGEDLARKARFFASQGLASLATVGRNVLVHEGGPVLLVMDSNTLDPQLAAEVRSLNRVAMSGAITSGGQIQVLTAAPAEQFRVFTFVPEIEAVFFESPQVLARILGKAPPKEKVKEGRLVPRQTLSDLFANAKVQREYKAILKDGDPQIQQAIASGPQARALKEMVESLVDSPARVEADGGVPPG
jgi:hypothetical protein